MSYAEIEKRVNLSIEHFKKPCLRGDCEQDGEVVIHCERHQDTSAIVRRYLRMQKFIEIKELADGDGCLDPENCGSNLTGSWDDFCSNCSEDMEHAFQCRMDLFYQGRN